MTSKQSHTSHTAIVTGAAGGLGRAIATRLLEDGANVVICDINDSLLEDFEREVSSRYPEKTLVLKINVTRDAELDTLFHKAIEKFEKVDIVVNNCGIMDDMSPAGQMSRELWDRVIAINLTAPAMVTQRAVNHFIEKGVKGAILNIASAAGIRGGMSGAAYTASKHGLLGLTKNTGVFYRDKGVRCNAIMAGGMRTNISAPYMNGGMNMEAFGAMQKHYPMENMVLVEIEKVASLASWLTSDDASIVNGACWTADGGLTAV